MIELLGLLALADATFIFFYVSFVRMKFRDHLRILHNEEILDTSEFESLLNDYGGGSIDLFSFIKPFFLPRLDDIKSEKPALIAYLDFRNRSGFILRLSAIIVVVLLVLAYLYDTVF